MQITLTNSEGLTRELRVVVPAADIETKLTGRLTEIAQTVQIPGFRPGKVPMPLLRKRFGDAVRGEVLERTIQDATSNAITEHKFRPALQPKIELVTFEQGKDLEYKLNVEVLPEFEPMDFGSVALERLKAEVNEEEVAAALKRVAEQRKHFKPVPEGTPAANGNEVVFDMVGRVDGEIYEGGSANDFVLELGSNRFVPGFEEQLIGATAGSDLRVKVTFPADYWMEKLRDKEVEFDVKLKEVRAAEQVAVDDDLGKALGLENLETLKGAIHEQLDRDYAQVTRSRLKRQLLDKLADGHSFEVPPGMLNQEFEQIWKQVQEATQRGQPDEDDKGKTEDEVKARYRDIALRRVRLGLLLSEVGRRNNITVTQDDLNRAMSEQARRFPGQEMQVFRYFQQNPQAMHELHAPIFEDKVIDFIVALAKVDERRVPVAELLADPDGAQAAPAGGAETEEAEPEAEKPKAKTRRRSRKAEAKGEGG
jgi:trigger factor